MALNSVNLNSVLCRDVNPAVRAVLKRLVLDPTILGAYTMLFEGLSRDIKEEGKLGESNWSESSYLFGDLRL